MRIAIRFEPNRTPSKNSLLPVGVGARRVAGVLAREPAVAHGAASRRRGNEIAEVADRFVR